VNVKHHVLQHLTGLPQKVEMHEAIVTFEFLGLGVLVDKLEGNKRIPQIGDWK